MGRRRRALSTPCEIIRTDRASLDAHSFVVRLALRQHVPLRAGVIEKLLEDVAGRAEAELPGAELEEVQKRRSAITFRRSTVSKYRSWRRSLT